LGSSIKVLAFSTLLFFLIHGCWSLGKVSFAGQ
jgi:hypothetical protein